MQKLIVFAVALAAVSTGCYELISVSTAAARERAPTFAERFAPALPLLERASTPQPSAKPD